MARQKDIIYSLGSHVHHLPLQYFCRLPHMLMSVEPLWGNDVILVVNGYTCYVIVNPVSVMFDLSIMQHVSAL